MSEPIKVGDLVVMVKSCCADLMKHPLFSVVDIENFSQDPSVFCRFCWSPMHGPWAEGGQRKWHVPVSYLKRIPPLSELESEKHKEELTA